MPRRPTGADFERARRTVEQMVQARERRSTPRPRLRRGPKPPPGAQTLFEAQQEPERPGAYRE